MKDKIKEIVLEDFKIEVEEDDNFFELGLSDLDIFNLSLRIEDEFDVFFYDSNFEKVRTINDIVNLIE